MRALRLRDLALLAGLALAVTQVAPARAAEDYPSLSWSFAGPFGTFDKASAQRGFLIYQQVCSACHSMKQMYYRNLAAIGLSEAQIKAVAAAVTVEGPINDQGKPTTRPGLPSDHFKPAFANDQAARAANGGALPPDQSVLELAREGGANYIDALLQGYSDPPPGVTVGNGLYYNKVFPGHQIAMPQPLYPDEVTYTDGTKPTLAQEAHDVTTFLAFTANPDLNERHQMGVKVFLFLVFMTIITYIAKRRVWAAVH
jgi:ubiquinol-cytochrome c reductase cytochrome c1 subunit